MSMHRYFKTDTGYFVTSNDVPRAVELTEERYNSEIASLREREAQIELYVRGSISLDELPAAWRQEAEVAKELYDNPSLSDTEALNIITGQEYE